MEQTTIIAGGSLALWIIVLTFVWKASAVQTRSDEKLITVIEGIKSLATEVKGITDKGADFERRLTAVELLQRTHDQNSLARDAVLHDIQENVTQLRIAVGKIIAKE